MPAMASVARAVFGFTAAVTCFGAARAAQASDWYYCDNPPGYYPYVRTCNDPWRPVPAQPGSGAVPQVPAQNRFLANPYPPAATPKPPPVGLLPPATTPATEATEHPDKVCPSWNRNQTLPADELKPIDCVSPADTAVGFHVSSIPLSAARPEVRTFIASVNERLKKTKAGRRLSNDELAKDRDLGNESRVETAIGYPTMAMITHNQNAQMAIDAAFLEKAVGYIAAIDAKEAAARDQEQRAAAVKDKQEHEAEIAQQQQAVVAAENAKQEREATAPTTMTGQLTASIATATAPPLKHEDARQLAIDAAWRHDQKALSLLELASSGGDVEAEFGRGFYFNQIAHSYDRPAEKYFPLYGFSPLLDKLFESLPEWPRDLPPTPRDLIPKDISAAQTAFREALHWIQVASDQGEPESEAMLGEEWWREAFGFSAQAFAVGGPDQSVFTTVHQACDTAFQLVSQAASQNNAYAYYDLSLFYIGGHNPGPQQFMASVGCMRGDSQIQAQYLEKAAALGNLDAMLALADRAEFVGQAEVAASWRGQARKAAFAQKMRGIPNPCLDDPGCAAHVYGSPLQ
jgi:TPR repeat protein